MAVKLLHRQAADHQDDDLPTVRTQRDDPILAALERVRPSLGQGSHISSSAQGSVTTISMRPPHVKSFYCFPAELRRIQHRQAPRVCRLHARLYALS